MSAAGRRAVEQAFRSEYGAVLASLIRVLRDFDRAEEALQEAFSIALETWSEDATPARAGAWLLTTARNRATDRLRHEQMRSRRLADLTVSHPESVPAPDEREEHLIPDDQLRLIFTCCHPALPQEAQVALTLRTLGGLTTAEIAAAFFVPEATLAQRLVRAKHKIRKAGIAYRIPSPDELPERLEPVLAVLYLVFNEGYFPAHGEVPVREELCSEALRLAAMLTTLLPEPEVLGLYALLLLHDSRRVTRIGANGGVVPLSAQDRASWNRDQIASGVDLVKRALRLRRPGPYQIQAAIAALHAEAPSYEDTDWHQISLLYGELARRNSSPAVEVNRAVAVSMSHGPEAGLGILEAIAEGPGMASYQPYHAARADLLRRLGRVSDARAAYHLAIQLTSNRSTRRFLIAQCASV